MPYKPNVPDPDNFGLEDLTKIAENFNILDDSRIVEHNLDVSDPSNGYYVRWENGLQVCFRNSIITEWTDNRGEENGLYRYRIDSQPTAADFSETIYQSCSVGGGSPSNVRNELFFGKVSFGSTSEGFGSSSWLNPLLLSPFNISLGSEDFVSLGFFAIGRWK